MLMMVQMSVLAKVAIAVVNYRAMRAHRRVAREIARRERLLRERNPSCRAKDKQRRRSNSRVLWDWTARITTVAAFRGR